MLTRENRLVLETLEPLSGGRKCFRLINGVLVERTVKDVVPALKTNQEGLKKVLDDMVKQYKTKQDELDKWKVCLAPVGSFGSQILIYSVEKTQRSSCSSIILWGTFPQLQLAEHFFCDPITSELFSIWFSRLQHYASHARSELEAGHEPSNCHLWHPSF